MKTTLPEFKTFRNWYDVKGFSDRGALLLYRYLVWLSENSKDSYSEVLDKPFNEVFEIVDTDNHPARHSTGIEQMWRRSGYNLKFSDDLHKYINLLECMNVNIGDFISVEQAICRAKAEFMVENGIIISYDNEGNCLISTGKEYEEGACSNSNQRAEVH